MKKSKNLDIKNDDNHTALILATFKRQIKAVKTLLDNGANPDIQGQGGYTALHVAIQKDHIDCLKELIKHTHNTDHLLTLLEFTRNLSNDKAETILTDAIRKQSSSLYSPLLLAFITIALGYYGLYGLHIKIVETCIALLLAVLSSLNHSKIKPTNNPVKSNELCLNDSLEASQINNFYNSTKKYLKLILQYPTI